MTDRRNIPEPVTASAWCEDAPDLEGDAVRVHAEMTDVDEVALIVREEGEVITVHLDRVHAIALAGQIAAAATADHSLLPHGHGPDGPCV